MVVSELIEKLKTLDPIAVITTWDSYYDVETPEVFINKLWNGNILINNCNYGKAV